MESENLLKRDRGLDAPGLANDSVDPRAKKAKLDTGVDSDHVAPASLGNDEQPSTGVLNGEATEAVTASDGANPRSERAPKRKWQDKHPKKPVKGRRAQMVKNREGGGKGDTWGPRPEGEGDVSGKPRLPKRKVALLVGFCGTGCRGMQYNPPFRTIEGLLFEGLVKAGCVSEDNADDPTKVSLQRAARTDAGVHAAGNIVSLKMITELPGVEDIVQHINSFLPPEIRIWGFVRTNNGFNARTACDSRVYEYLFPSYMLLPPKPGTKMALQIASDKPVSDSDVVAEAESSRTGDVHPFWAVSESEEKDIDRKRRWRCPPEPLARLRGLVKAFEGSHNFYNYTIGKDFKDKTIKRYILSVEVRDPQVVGDMEWISVKFHGQSFMLHQIRKMISMAILACRASSPASLILESYGPTRIRIPKAPALGLLLEEPQFGVYNTHMEQHNKKTDDMIARGKEAQAQLRDPIDFGKYATEIQKFKLEHIYDKLRAEEAANGDFDLWIRGVDDYSDYNFAFFNRKGIIPPEATANAPQPKEGKNVVGVKTKEGPPKMDDALVDSDDDVDPGMMNSEEMEG